MLRNALCLLFLFGLSTPLAADGVDLTGTWIAESDGTQVSVTFTAKGRITIVEKTALGSGTSHGRYRTQGAEIRVVLDGTTDVLRYPYQLQGGVLLVRDQDGTQLRFTRAGKKADKGTKTAGKAGPGCTPVTTLVQWIHTDRGGLRHPATGQWLEAFRMWVPEGWRVTGGVRWKINARTVHTIKRSDLVNPAVIEFTIEAPDGDAAITVYPEDHFTDLSGAPAARMFPKGSDYGGRTSWPVLDPRGYVQQILLPRYFRTARGVRIVGHKNAPELAAHFRDELMQFNRVAPSAGIARMSLAAGITTVDFQARGKAYREHFVTAPMYIRMPGMVMWWPRMAWSVRARKDCMERMLPSLLTSIYSFRLNAWWFLLYERLRHDNWAGVAAVDATIAKIDSAIVASRAKTASKIHRQLYPVITGLSTKGAPGYAPLALDGTKNHAVDPEGRLRELPDTTNMNDLPPGWKPMKQVPIK
ncbi:MAG: hypothetical protein QNJ90_10665 [Planctomycetota bacterium]|nr:hypothetical protein [Planctomycetota bacterium]